MKRVIILFAIFFVSCGYTVDSREQHDGSSDSGIDHDVDVVSDDTSDVLDKSVYRGMEVKNSSPEKFTQLNMHFKFDNGQTYDTVRHYYTSGNGYVKTYFNGREVSSSIGVTVKKDSFRFQKVDGHVCGCRRSTRSAEEPEAVYNPPKGCFKVVVDVDMLEQKCDAYEYKDICPAGSLEILDQMISLAPAPCM